MRPRTGDAVDAYVVAARAPEEKCRRRSSSSRSRLRLLRRSIFPPPTRSSRWDGSVRRRGVIGSETVRTSPGREGVVILARCSEHGGVCVGGHLF